MSDPYGFAQLEQQYGLPSGYLARTAQIESGMNPNAQNPRSSAGGLFQFIDSTAEQYGLSNRMDPVAASEAAARLAADNMRYLEGRLGRPLSAAELYMAHQQGAGGAYSLLSNPNARASDLVGAAAVGLNGGNGPMSGAEFADHVLNYFGQVEGQSAPDMPEMAALRQTPGMADPRAGMMPQRPDEPQQNALAFPQLNYQTNALDPNTFATPVNALYDPLRHFRGA